MAKAESRTLSEKVRRGALISIANALLIRLTSVFITAIVAHILDPRDFGAYAVALTAYAIVTVICQSGVASCLIRADLDIDSLAPTMVTVSLTSSAIMAGVLAAFARPIASALGSSYATGPVRVIALSVLLAGVFAVPGAQLARDFRQDKLLLADIISFVPSNAALLILARSGSGAMAFAWSRLIGECIVGCVWLVSVPKIYPLGFARDALTVLFRFGLPFAAANFINNILLNVDNALIGHLMGAVELGTYVLAFNVASWPYTLLGTMINSVAMPAFSRVKHDAKLLNDAITTALRDLSIVVMPICCVMMAVARPLILTVYGEKWAASAQVLTVLLVYSAISIVCMLFSSLLGSMGRTKLLLAIQLIWLVTLAPAMAIGIHRNGLVGAAFAHIVVIGPIVLPCYLIAVKRTTGVGYASIGKAVFPALLCSSIAALAVRVTVSQFSNPSVQLITGLSVGGLAYIIFAGPHAITLLNRGKATGLRMRRIIRLYSTAARLVGLTGYSPPKHAAGDRAKYAGESGIGNAQRAPKPARAYYSSGDDYGIGNGRVSDTRYVTNGHSRLYTQNWGSHHAALDSTGPLQVYRPDGIDWLSGHMRPDMPDKASTGAQQGTAWWRTWHRSGPRPATAESGAPGESTGSRTAPARPYARIVSFTLLDNKVADFDRLVERTVNEVGIREPGTLVYAVHLVPNAPLQRIFYEIYRDRAAFKIHQSQPYMRRFLAELQSCVLSANVIEVRLKDAMVALMPTPQPFQPGPALPNAGTVAPPSAAVGPNPEIASTPFVAAARSKFFVAGSGGRP